MPPSPIPKALPPWLALLLLALSPAVTAQPTVTFSCWIQPDTPIYSRLEQLYRESFAALGYEFAMHHRPNQRSLMEAESGQSDGDCARTHDYTSQNPESRLVMVDTLIAQTTLEAWGHREGLTLSSTDELHREDWRIGYERGNVAVQALINQHSLPAVIPVVSSRSGLKMLAARRIDLFIGTSVSTRQILEQMTLPRPIYSAGDLMVLRGHAVMNERHRDLAPKLAKELKERLPEGGWRLAPPTEEVSEPDSALQ